MWRPLPIGGGGGGSLNTLEVDYDTSSSALVLSDPVDGVMSQAAVVSGRTILINGLVINGQNKLSCLGPSNSVSRLPLRLH